MVANICLIRFCKAKISCDVIVGNRSAADLSSGLLNMETMAIASGTVSNDDFTLCHNSVLEYRHRGRILYKISKKKI
jgi:hypothetical protein